MNEDAPAAEIPVEETPIKGTAEWYDAMSRALKLREHAQTMIIRWTETLAKREADVEVLATSPEA